MITYELDSYSVRFAFTRKGSVFPKSCVWALPSAVVAYFINFFLVDGDELKQNNDLSMMGSFTFILGFLIVFKAQHAYSRWWEGGTLLCQMRGEWFNAYSSLLAFTNSDPSKQDQVRIFQERIVRLMSLLYSNALDQVATAATEESLRFPFFDPTGMDPKSLAFLQESSDRCEITLQWIQRLVMQSDADGIVKEKYEVAPPILSRVYQQLGNGIVNLNNARKIKELPIPFPLAQMVTVMLIFHWFSTTFYCATSLNSPHTAAIISFINVFVCWCINYIACELENPFGEDLNDLPLEEMQEDYNKSLARLLHKRALNPPSFEFDNFRKLSLSTIELNAKRGTVQGLTLFLGKMNSSGNKSLSSAGSNDSWDPIIDVPSETNQNKWHATSTSEDTAGKDTIEADLRPPPIRSHEHPTAGSAQVSHPSAREHSDGQDSNRRGFAIGVSTTSLGVNELDSAPSKANSSSQGDTLRGNGVAAVPSGDYCGMLPL